MTDRTHDLTGCYGIDYSRSRYMQDTHFHALVQVLLDAALNHGFTPGELRDVAHLAACMAEERRVKPVRVVVGEPPPPQGPDVRCLKEGEKPPPAPPTGQGRSKP